MIDIEIMKKYHDGKPVMERKSFRNKKDMYQYILFDMMERAREELDDNDFTSLCLQICGFMAEYFT